MNANVSKKILVSGILVEDATSDVHYSIVSTGENNLTAVIDNAELLRWLEAEYGTKFNSVLEWVCSAISDSFSATLATFLEDRLNGEAYFQQLRHLAIAEDFKHFCL